MKMRRAQFAEVWTDEYESVIAVKQKGGTYLVYVAEACVSDDGWVRSKIRQQLDEITIDTKTAIYNALRVGE